MRREQNTCGEMGSQRRRFRLTGKGPAAGHEFEVPADASEEEIANAAAQVYLEFSDFGWKEVE